MNLSHDFLQEMTALLPTLRVFARSLCPDAAWADDLVQDTLLKAWNSREQYQPDSNMRAWLLTILRNSYYSELRHRKFEVEDPNDQYAASVTVPPEHEAVSEIEALMHALRGLPDEQREALLLVCASGLSYKQTAAICNCAVGTIKSRIARARDHLADALGYDGYEPGAQAQPDHSRIRAVQTQPHRHKRCDTSS